MKAIVCFSGGHSSALAAIETVRKYGVENTILLNHDISSRVEHADIKRFKREVAQYCGVPITYANMRNFEELTPLKIAVASKGFQAVPGKAFCTSRLKTEPFYHFLGQFPRSPDIHVCYGFDAEETSRINRRADIIRAMGFTPEFPLVDWPRIVERTEDVGIPRPVTYRIYKHANCIGCLKAGRQHWYCVFCTRPDIWAEAKTAELVLGHSIIKGIYLKELESKFRDMRDHLRICPNDRENSASFWAKVRKAIPDDEDTLPCDCAF